MKKSKIPYIFFAFFAIIIAFGIKFKYNKSYNNLKTESLRQASDLNDKAEDLYYNQAKYQESLELHLKALNIQQEQAPNSLDEARSYRGIGAAYNDLKEYKQAINYFEKEIKIRVDKAPNSLDLASSYNNIGLAYNGLKEYKQAINYFEKAVTIKEKQAPNSLDLASSYNDIVIAYYDLKEYKQAINYYEKVIKIKEDKAPNSLDLASSYSNIGLAYNGLKEYKQAINYFEKAIKIQVDKAPNSSNLADNYYNIGIAYNGLKEYDKGFNNYAKSLGYDGGISDGIISMVGKITSGKSNLQSAAKLLIRKTSNDNFKVGNIIDKYVIFQTFRNYDLVQIAVVKEPNEIYIDQSILKGKYFAIIGREQFTKVFGGNSEILVLKKIE